MRIMLVDDERDIRELFSRMLHQKGYDTDKFSNGAEAVTAVEDKKNDAEVMVIDNRMPILDGIEATRRIRKINPKMKVIMASANDLEDSERSLFDAILTKPISFHQLVSTIQGVSPS